MLTPRLVIVSVSSENSIEKQKTYFNSPSLVPSLFMTWESGDWVGYANSKDLASPQKGFTQIRVLGNNPENRVITKLLPLEQSAGILFSKLLTVNDVFHYGILSSRSELVFFKYEEGESRESVNNLNNDTAVEQFESCKSSNLLAVQCIEDYISDWYEKKNSVHLLSNFRIYLDNHKCY